MSRYYALTLFDWQPFNDLVGTAESSAPAKLLQGLISTGLIKIDAADDPEYQELLSHSLQQLLQAEEWYHGATADEIAERGKLLDAVFNLRDPLWCYPTRGEYVVLREFVRFIVGTVEFDAVELSGEWSCRDIVGAVPRTRELQWLGNRPFRCGCWDGAELTQREFERRYQRKPYSIHSPEQVALLQADIADAADTCRLLPFEELRDEYSSLARQIDKAVRTGQALYVRHVAAHELQTRPPDHVIERIFSDVGIQIGPREQKVHANPYFNELRCGDLKQLAYVAKTRAAEFPEVGTDCEALGAQGNPAFCYRMSIAKCLWIVYDCHFGFCGALRPEVAAKKGLDMALKYFQVVRELLPTAADARDWMQGAAWVEPYSEALLLAILAGGTVERTMLSDYLLEDAIVDKLPLRPSAAALGVPLLCIAASFQSSQVDMNALIKRIQKSRQRRPSLLCEAWQALQNKNHSKFTAALADSTMIFARTTASDDRPFTAIALPESILAGLAYESGWTDLSFDLPVAARLVTRRSLAMN